MRIPDIIAMKMTESGERRETIKMVQFIPVAAEPQP